MATANKSSAGLSVTLVRSIIGRIEAHKADVYKRQCEACIG